MKTTRLICLLATTVAVMFFMVHSNAAAADKVVVMISGAFCMSRPCSSSVWARATPKAAMVRDAPRAAALPKVSAGRKGQRFSWYQNRPGCKLIK